MKLKTGRQYTLEGNQVLTKAEKRLEKKQELERKVNVVQNTDPDFNPIDSWEVTHTVTSKLATLWHSVYNNDFERWLDIVLSALERREEDYMKLIKGIEKQTLDVYVKMYSELFNFFINGYYGDPLGNFFMENISHGRNGECYTPWNIALIMAMMLDLKPEDDLMDPCVGSGILLLAARYVIHQKYGWYISSCYGRHLYGMDISSTAMKMAKINLYLTDYLYMMALTEKTVNEVSLRLVQTRSQLKST